MVQCWVGTDTAASIVVGGEGEVIALWRLWLPQVRSMVGFGESLWGLVAAIASGPHYSTQANAIPCTDVDQLKWGRFAVAGCLPRHAPALHTVQ